MQNKPIRIGPVALAAAVANIFNCAITSTAGPVGITLPQPYVLLTHFRVVNKTAAAINVSLFIGATGASAAGTEFTWNATQVPANSYVESFNRVPLSATDFLTGFGSATGLTFEAEGEVGFSG